MSGTRTYRVWCGMHQRCENPNVAAYDRYAGRGIKVCEQWKTFSAFFKDMGECPPRMTLERIKNDSDYSRGNCQWASYSAQARNTRRNLLLTHDGVTRPLIEWTEITGIPYARIRGRIKRGYAPKDCLAKGALKRRFRGKTFVRDGITKYVREWAEITGIKYDVLRNRIQRGWPEDRIFST